LRALAAREDEARVMEARLQRLEHELEVSREQQVHDLVKEALGRVARALAEAPASSTPPSSTSYASFGEDEGEGVGVTSGDKRLQSMKEGKWERKVLSGNTETARFSKGSSNRHLRRRRGGGQDKDVKSGGRTKTGANGGQLEKKAVNDSTPACWSYLRRLLTVCIVAVAAAAAAWLDSFGSIGGVEAMWRRTGGGWSLRSTLTSTITAVDAPGTEAKYPGDTQVVRSPAASAEDNTLHLRLTPFVAAEYTLHTQFGHVNEDARSVSSAVAGPQTPSHVPDLTNVHRRSGPGAGESSSGADEGTLLEVGADVDLDVGVGVARRYGGADIDEKVATVSAQSMPAATLDSMAIETEAVLVVVPTGTDDISAARGEPATADAMLPDTMLPDATLPERSTAPWLWAAPEATGPTAAPTAAAAFAASITGASDAAIASTTTPLTAGITMGSTLDVAAVAVAAAVDVDPALASARAAAAAAAEQAAVGKDAAAALETQVTAVEVASVSDTASAAAVSSATATATAAAASASAATAALLPPGEEELSEEAAWEHSIKEGWATWRRSGGSDRRGRVKAAARRAEAAVAAARQGRGHAETAAVHLLGLRTALDTAAAAAGDTDAAVVADGRVGVGAGGGGGGTGGEGSRSFGGRSSGGGGGGGGATERQRLTFEAHEAAAEEASARRKWESLRAKAVAGVRVLEAGVRVLRD
jgi:hypothetical protein